MDTKTETIL